MLPCQSMFFVSERMAVVPLGRIVMLGGGQQRAGRSNVACMLCHMEYRWIPMVLLHSNPLSEFSHKGQCDASKGPEEPMDPENCQWDLLQSSSHLRVSPEAHSFEKRERISIADIAA